MRWLRWFWFKILKFIGIPMTSAHENCISGLEDKLSGLTDDEAMLVEKMLDAGCDCDSVFATLWTARRKQALKRKLIQLGIKGSSLEHLIEKFLPDLRGSSKVDDLVSKASHEYNDALEKRKKSHLKSN